MQIDNQQRSNKTIYNGKIKSEELTNIIKEYQEGQSLIKLSQNYNYNIATIRYALIKNDIIIRNVKESVKPFQKLKKINSTSFLNENLIGWILGDGGIRLPKKAKNPYFHYTDKKQSHILYVEKILNSYNIKTKIIQNKKSGCYQLQTESLSFFHYFYNLFYGYEGLNENNEKRKILPNIQLTPIILRNWFIGDGSSSKQIGTLNNRGSICCKFKNEFVLNQLNEICGKVSCNKYKTKTGSCHNYHFNNKALTKLLEYIGECPVEEYKYKWIVKRSTTIIEPSLKDEGIV